MSAIIKLAVEAKHNGLLAPELAAGIQRVEGAKSIGVRAGNWLSLKQAQALLNAPYIMTAKGLRDRAIIAVLLGGTLRRCEARVLTDGRSSGGFTPDAAAAARYATTPELWGALKAEIGISLPKGRAKKT